MSILGTKILARWADRRAARNAIPQPTDADYKLISRLDIASRVAYRQNKNYQQL